MIPLNQAGLERVFDNDFCLVFQPPAVTIERIIMLRNNKLGTGNPLVATPDRWPPSIMSHTMRPGWRVWSRGVLPNSVGQNYHGQTEALISTARRVLWLSSHHVPRSTCFAFSAFRQCSDHLESLLEIGAHETSVEAARILSALTVSHILRPRPVELVWYLTLYEAINGEHLLGDGCYAATNQLIDEYRFIDVSHLPSGGLTFGKGWPGAKIDSAGTFFSWGSR
jgi:hypothetical protein